MNFVTPGNPPEIQRAIDAEHLRLLRIGYFISAGYTGFFALMGLLYMSMGVFVGSMMQHVVVTHGAEPPPNFFGYIFGVIGGFISVMAGTVAALKLRMARCLRLRTSHGFSVFVAVVTCLEIPYGTALGILTMVVLNRPSVRSLFQPGQDMPVRPRDPNVT